MGEYSDDDLDDLPESALQQLEDNALLSTQAPRRVAPAQQLIRPNPPPFDSLGLDDDDDLDLDDSDVFAHSTAAVPRVSQAPAAAGHGRGYQPQQSQGVPRWNGRPVNTPAGPQAGRPYPNPSQGRWNGRVPSVHANIPRPSNNPPFRPPSLHNPPQPSQSSRQPFRQPSLHNAPASQFPRGFAPPPQRYAPSQSQAPQLPPLGLEARLRALESELNVSRGEAAILRANTTKAQQANEAEIARLLKQNAEQEARHERALQAALQAERAKATELEFAQREVKEVAERSRRRDVTAGTTTGAANAGSGATTPKKAGRTWGFADGFDGMDFVPSPGKGMGRTKSAPMPVQERTPSKGKRKRPIESPVPPLDTTEEFVVEAQPSAHAAMRAVPPQVPASLYSLPFDVCSLSSVNVYQYANTPQLLPLILDHSPGHGQPPTFDTFARYFYPSDPKTSFSSIIFQSLPTKTDPGSSIRLLTDFSVLFINLWERCLQEEFFLPMRELVSLLSFTLQLHSVSIVPGVVEKLLPIAQTTLHVIADVRAACSSEGAALDPELQQLYQNLDSTEVVALLNLCASVCATSTEDINGVSARAVFWREFPMETISLVLGSKQPLPDVVGMLEMLATSALPGSIGPLVSDQDQSAVADVLLDKLSKFLVSAPSSARSPSQRHAVVISALRTLLSFTADEQVAKRMAEHENLIPRAITALSRSVEELYDQELTDTTLNRPCAPSLDEALDITGPDSDPWNLCTLISHATLLLHGLITDPRTAELVELEKRFAEWHLGGRRYLIALCRLTFADEDGVLEVGIDGETAERAHELLEMVVSAEGGRDVEMVFASQEY